MRPFLHSSARRPGALVLLAVAALLVATSASTALAHSDEGVMEITRFEQNGPGSVELEVGIVYANDEHQAENASVAATITGPGGATVGPVELMPVSDSGSLYATTLSLPAGTWTAQVTSTNPEATANGSIDVGEVPTETVDTEAPTTTADSADSAMTVVTEEPDAVEGETAAVDGSDDGGGSTGLLVTAAVIAGAVIGGGAYLASRRRSHAGDTIE